MPEHGHPLSQPASYRSTDIRNSKLSISSIRRFRVAPEVVSSKSTKTVSERCTDGRRPPPAAAADHLDDPRRLSQSAQPPPPPSHMACDSSARPWCRREGGVLLEEHSRLAHYRLPTHAVLRVPLPIPYQISHCLRASIGSIPLRFLRYRCSWCALKFEPSSSFFFYKLNEPAGRCHYN